MPWNGSGVFSRIYSWVADAAASIDITASRMDNDTNDIVTNGLNNCLTRDGQGQPTANLPMDAFKHTGAGVGANSGDYAVMGLNLPIPAAGNAGQSLGITLTGSGYQTQGPALSLKNRLMNGAMLIDQANEGASVAVVTTGSPYGPDQWQLSFTGAATGVTMQRVAAPAGFAGLSAALKVTIGTGSATLNAGDFMTIVQNLEGNNTADLGFGTAAAKAVSLRFWAQSSISGTFGIAIRNVFNNRCYTATFALTANTPQLVTITNIPGDVSGTWNSDNTLGISVAITLLAGSSHQGTANVWQAGNILTTSSQTNLGANTGATFQVSGVQLELGPACTAFDVRSIQAEMLLCVRYYRKSFATGVKPAQGNLDYTGSFTGSIWAAGGNPFTMGTVAFETPMRVTPTITTYNPGDGNAFAINVTRATDFTATSAVNVANSGFSLSGTPNGGNAAPTDSYAVHWTADARL